MCGILGVIALDNNEPIAPSKLVRMSDTMSHRGPDGDGFLFAGNVDRNLIDKSVAGRDKTYLFQCDNHRSIGLAHRRLSIIDLSTVAFQPMSDADGDVWIIFNGEIYNHKEIRPELERDGYKFKTSHSDTEMMIYAYKKWGIECIHKFRGMFAFCLWDKKKDLFYMVRDRIGIKPLYYTQANGRFYFASEIKAIIEDETVKRELNEQGFYDYFTFLTVPAPNTLFANIYKLKPGHYIKIENGKVSEQTEYWDIYDNVEYHGNKTQERIQEELIDLLRTSVKYRLEADVPVGVFLSGGVDSSLNTALFSEISDKPVQAFTVGYANDEKLSTYKNEFEYARKVAKQFGCDYHELALTQKDLMDFLPQLIHHQDEPIADPVCVPVYFVSKLARDNGVTVCQVGEGSDELFWGYETWKRFSNLQAKSELPFAGLGMHAGMGALKMMGKEYSLPYEMMYRGTHQDKQLFWGGITSFAENEKKAIMHPQLRNQFKDYTTWEIIKPYYTKYLASTPEKAQVNWMSYFDVKVRIAELLLMRVDKMSMAVSLEARVPFLDHKFVEYAMGIPAAMKTKNGETKHILKKAVEGILPPEIIYRKKQGFGTPVFEWFFEDLGKFAMEEINSFAKETEIIDPKMIKHYFDTKQGTKVWYILNFVMWWKEFVKR